MSLLLTDILSQKEIFVKTTGLMPFIDVGSYYISYDDFCEVIKYFLANDDLFSDDDPRIQLMRELKLYNIIEGHMPKRHAIGDVENEILNLKFQALNKKLNPPKS